jgi:hypothetical protein
MNVKHYLIELIKQGHFWQYTDVNGHGKRPKMYFMNWQWVLIVLVVPLAIFILPNGFNETFVGYIIAALSIFVGLFLTLILTVFDKFQKIDFESAKYSDKKGEEQIRIKNFFKQFSSLTAYSILLSILTVILLSTFLLIESTNNKINIDTIINHFNNTKFIIKVLALLLYRIVTLYFLFDFIIITVYAITSIHSFIILEYNKVKIKKQEND